MPYNVSGGHFPLFADAMFLSIDQPFSLRLYTLCPLYIFMNCHPMIPLFATNTE